MMAVVFLSACDSSDEETGPYDCSRGAIPAGAQCFEFQGVEHAFRYDEPGVLGRWSSTEFETCIEYQSDGTGTIRYWGIVGGVPRDDTGILWGIWSDFDGNAVVSTDGRPIVVHHGADGPVLDARLVGVGFDQTGGLSGDFERVDVCPENAESEQGTITFFTTHSGTDAITIGLDSFVVGELTEIVTGDHPDCGVETDAKVLTVYRQPGTYRFQAVSSVATWGPTNIEVTKGECTAHNLQ